MPTTFLNLTNSLLRRLNEVEIAEVEFSGVRGVQSLSKDAVQNSINKINQAEYKWPFNAAEHTQVLAVGQEEYSWPSSFKVADWNTFQLQKDDTLNTNHMTLQTISRDEYYNSHADLDDDSGTSGRGIPIYAWPGHGNGYGVSPSPDKAYTLKFRYYLQPTALSNFSDTSRIPDTYDHVILDGALYYMYMFRDNPEQAGVTSQLFLQGIKEMQGILINKYQSVRDTRIQRQRGLRTSFSNY
jgi:hypothetical protein